MIFSFSFCLSLVDRYSTDGSIRRKVNGICLPSKWQHQRPCERRRRPSQRALTRMAESQHEHHSLYFSLCVDKKLNMLLLCMYPKVSLIFAFFSWQSARLLHVYTLPTVYIRRREGLYMYYSFLLFSSQFHHPPTKLLYSLDLFTSSANKQSMCTFSIAVYNLILTFVIIIQHCMSPGRRTTICIVK